MKILFVTLGCKANQYDTGAMEAKLNAAGHTTCMEGETPDAIVINSCTVTEESDRKTRQTVRRYAKHHPSALMILCGCSAQRDPEEYLNMPEVDCVLGTGNRGDILYAVEQGKKGEKLNLATDPSTVFEEMGTAATHRTRGFLKIQDGCDRYCTYCIIPYVRGPIRSRDLAEVVAEAEAMAQSGIREVVLTGIRLISFGHETGLGLMDAVDAVARIHGVERIRLGSLDPDEVDAAFIARAAGQKKLCRQFHLSLQSGCDTVLRRMGRRYSTAQFLEVAKGINAAMADAAITTDVMVGFVGETEEEFLTTCNFVKEVGFSRLHVFPYSVRRGTAAARMEGHLKKEVKQERSRRLIAIGEELESAFVKKNIGTTHRAVFEEQAGGDMVGYTDSYIRIKAPYREDLLGVPVMVNILEEEKGCGIAAIQE